MSLPLRQDLAFISEWIASGARILDLGCGDGTLLRSLAEGRGVSGYGLDIDADNIAACIESGVDAIQADVDEGLADFADGSFDYVVMTEALQALARPDRVVAEMLRVGREAIVTFPNFGHWRVRASLAGGRMPQTPALPAAPTRRPSEARWEREGPHAPASAPTSPREDTVTPAQWYDTPNIHLCTVADFEELCRARGWRVLARGLLDRRHRTGALIAAAPNLFCEVALYKLCRDATRS
jgi:methionine biosynthesis protein MetW